MTVWPRYAAALLCAVLPASGLAACASSVSTASFSGDEHTVAQAISNLQTDARAGDAQKVCASDLASAVVARLSKARGGCKQAIKNQLAEVDSLELNVQSIHIAGAGTKRTASASVKSVFSGKTRPGRISLAYEAGRWQVSGL
jgi:hypothetical protein